MSSFPPPGVAAVLAVSAGAVLGALARWQLGLWLNAGGWLPWGTLAANLVGGLLIGLAMAVFQAQPDLSPAWKLFVITGFLGALTTFSSFSAEVVGMLMEGRWGAALATAALHLAGTLALTGLGIWLGATLLVAARGRFS